MEAATLVRGAIDAQAVQALLALVDAHPAWATRQGAGFDPHSSSLPLASLPALDIDGLARRLLRGVAGESCRRGLSDALAIAIDRSWVRRQYAPANAPARHAAHAWHQDGALGFDFLAAGRERASGRPVPMRTCWIALTACGEHAPGLAICETAHARLLELDELVDAGRAGATRVWTPTLQPGDALVFDGSVLHRTHVCASMHADRTSLELRFVDGQHLPDRLRGDRFLTLH